MCAASPAWDRTAEMHVGRAGYVGLNRIGADLYNVALVVPQAGAAAARGATERFFFATVRPRFPGCGAASMPADWSARSW